LPSDIVAMTPAEPPPTAPEHGTAAPVRTAFGLLRPLAWVLGGSLAVLLLMLAGMAGTARWLFFTEGGATWALARVPGVEVVGFEGTLLGDELRATRLSFPAGAHRITIDGLLARGLRWHARPQAGVWVGLDAEAMSARRVTVVRGPPGPPPTELLLPLQLKLQTLAVDEVVVDTQPPLQAVRARGLTLDSAGSGRHGVQALSLHWQGHALTGRVDIGAAAPMPLDASLTLVPAPAPAATALAASAAASGPAAAAAAARAPALPPRWAAVLNARGPLQLLDVDAVLRGVPAAGSREGAAGPAVDLRARVAPFAAWPLDQLDLRTEALDLSALAAGAPQTRLSGSAQARAAAADAPIGISLALDNALPGRWNEGRLPLRRLVLELQGSTQQRERIEVRSFDLTLADAKASAGQWRGSALWLKHELTLDTVLAGVVPQRLDGRAAAMLLSGPVKGRIDGLPSPDPAHNREPGRPPLAGELELQLDGRFQGAPAPVQLGLRLSGDAQQLQIEHARAESGSAVADLKAVLRRVTLPAGPGSGSLPAAAGRGGQPGWQLQTSGSLSDFDPLPWWPGEAGSAWRQGRHRLSAGWQFDGRVPTSATGLAPLALLQRVAGNGQLRLHDSQLAGVPLEGEVTLAYGQAGSPTLGKLHADLRLGANRVLADGEGDPNSDGAGDRWTLELQAGQLAGLAPLAALSPALNDWVPRQGGLNASMNAAGRWPALRTEGTAALQQLQVGTLSVQRGQARWRLDSRAGDPARSLLLQADASGLQYGAQQLANLSAQVSGTLAAHRITLDASSNQAPPALAEQMLSVRRQRGTRALLRADGAWTDAPGGAQRWRTRIERLAVEGWDGKTQASADGGLFAPAAAGAASAAASAPAPTPAASAAPGAAPTAGAVRATPANGSASTWIEARDLQGELLFGADGQLQRLQAEAGRLRLADVAALRWEQVLIDRRAERTDIRLRAEVEALSVAPLLQRAMPSMGWTGDLRVGARINVQADERFSAEVLLERVGGDLHIDGDSGLQLLGLTDLRMGLIARDGVWNFRQAFSGRSIGQMGANLRVRTTPERRWPEDQAPVDGNIEARVSDIGVWSNWVPPGWRLGGSVSTVADISGRFGEPQFTGTLTGSGLGVRNLLQGVNVSQGEVAIQLQGDTAQIQRFTAKGGDGSISITGGANLGREPKAQLQLKAERFRVLGRVDRQLTASGDAELRLARDQVKLDGRLRVDEALFDASRSDAPSLDDDVVVRRTQAEIDDAASAAAPRPRRNVDVGLDVDLGQQLRVKGRGLDTELRGQLRITTPGGRLAVAGTVRTDSGTYAAYGQKLEIERGLLAFSGAPDNPRLDVLALRPNIDIRVGVAITGTLLTPRVRLYSDPEMGETDKLSWLVLGRAPDGLGRTDTALLQRAAVALLAGEGDAPTDAIMRTLGIDDVSLRQNDGETRETVISLGKQLSRRWYLGYERGVNATTGTWQLIYRIAQRLTVRAQSGLENSLDIIWVWRVGEPPEGPVPKSAPAPASAASAAPP
jgi:translocation and assembly module TamB